MKMQAKHPIERTKGNYVTLLRDIDKKFWTLTYRIDGQVTREHYTEYAPGRERYDRLRHELFPPRKP